MEPTAEARSPGRKNVLAALLANILEWYDFGLYGYFAPVLARLFFPSEDHLASLMGVFIVFAVGFLFRPLGAAAFGHWGDKVSRNQALIGSVMLMVVPTTLLGLLPTYEQIGFSATLLLVAIRILQGLSVGGQMGGSLTVLVENAPDHRRGSIGSWANAGAILGMLIGSGLGALLTGLSSAEWLDAWGWRIPFVLGVIPGVASFWLKNHLEETDHFEKLKQDGQIVESPLKEALVGYWREMLLAFGIIWVSAVSFYMVFVFMTTYLSTETPVPLSKALEVNTVSMVVFMGLVLVMGRLSDRFGRKPLLVGGSVGLVILSYPLFLLLTKGDPLLDLAAQCVFAVVIAAIQGVVPTTVAELFPARLRCTAIAVVYNVAFAIFGGTAPLICTFLIKHTHDKLSPSYYLILTSVVCTLLVFRIKESYRRPLSR